jgi:hypothetical protein
MDTMYKVPRETEKSNLNDELDRLNDTYRVKKWLAYTKRGTVKYVH